MNGAPTTPHSPAGRPGTGPGGPAGRRPATPVTGPPDDDDRAVERHATALARLFVEVEAGLRPQRHLERFSTPLLRSRLAAVQVRPEPATRLLSVHGCRTAADRFDAVALTVRCQRVTSVALALVRLRARWLLDEVGRPERAPLPAPAYPIPPEGALDAFELVLGAVR